MHKAVEAGRRFAELLLSQPISPQAKKALTDSFIDALHCHVELNRTRGKWLVEYIDWLAAERDRYAIKAASHG
jgi:hypothetical protein